jgi:KRAB domain-containing zinc finger protein
MHMKRRHLTKHPDVKFLYSEKLSVDVTDMYEKLNEPEGLTCVRIVFTHLNVRINLNFFHTGKSFCAYTDYDEDSLNEHLITHQDVVNSGKMYCNICPSPIPTMDFMREHTKFHNEKIKTHRCLVCQKTFPFDERFLNHLRNHKKNQHKICFCPECGRKFSKPRLMEDHIRFIHNKESLFCCPECGQGFGSKSALNGHIKRHMEGQKYQCPFCPKKFSSHNLLNSHKVVHSADRVRLLVESFPTLLN